MAGKAETKTMTALGKPFRLYDIGKGEFVGQQNVARGTRVRSQIPSDSAKHITMVGKAKTKTMPALGRPFRLGMLYDIRKDELVPGITLWDKATIQKTISVQDQPHEEGSAGSIIAEDSIEKKANALGIEGDLKLSFMGGLIEVSGSADYLGDRKSSSRKARVTLKFSTTTRFEQLSMELLGTDNVKYPDAFENDIATHIVTAIMYGGQAFFVFDREVSETENFKKIKGNLLARVKLLPGIQIEGDASVKMDEHDRRVVKKFNCTFYGDFIPDRNPTTYEDAVLLYQNLPRMMLGEDRRKARPVKVWLYPLENLDSKAAKMFREISVNLVNRVEHVFEELQNDQMRCNDLMKEDVCTYFPRIKDQLFKFQKMVSEFKITFQQYLLPVLPKIRGRGADETHLDQKLLDNERSPFSCSNLRVWLDEKEREVKVLRSYVNLLNDIQFAYGPGDLDSVIGDPANQIVICYTFKLSAKCDSLLFKLAEHLGTPAEEDDDVMPVLPWYKCKDVTQRMVKSARLFNQFALVNKHTNNIKTIITDEILSSDNHAKLGANIILYKDSVIIDDDFEPPSAPLCPTVKSVEHDSISLDCLPPKFGSQNVQQYEFTYRIIGDNNDDWQSSISKDTSVKLSKLRIAVAYEVKVRAVSVAGYSDFVNIPRAIVTLPTSPPSKPIATDVSATSLTLVWRKPMSTGKHVEIDHYKVFWKKIGDGNCTTVKTKKTKKTKSAVECLTIGGLNSKTTYTFHVVAVCGEAGCSAPSEDSNEVTTMQVIEAAKKLAQDAEEKAKLAQQQAEQEKVAGGLMNNVSSNSLQDIPCMEPASSASMIDTRDAVEGQSVLNKPVQNTNNNMMSEFTSLNRHCEYCENTRKEIRNTEHVNHGLASRLTECLKDLNNIKKEIKNEKSVIEMQKSNMATNKAHIEQLLKEKQDNAKLKKYSEEVTRQKNELEKKYKADMKKQSDDFKKQQAELNIVKGSLNRTADEQDDFKNLLSQRELYINDLQNNISSLEFEKMQMIKEYKKKLEKINYLESQNQQLQISLEDAEPKREDAQNI